ncbi:MAG TPA: VOC family protein [Solirubrobacterales bacterium]|jgi:catechol-2,3-dioxygenase|nr:VOC family protein [Solirubrobacterales bacterium]
MTRVISAIGHVALRVRDRAAVERVARDIIGLAESGRDDEWTYFTADTSHHSLQYAEGDEDAVDHLGLVAPGPAALEEIGRRLDAEGVRIIADRPLDPQLEEGLVFEAPGGFVFEVYVGMPSVEVPLPARGVRPTRFGHYTLTVADTAPLSDFLERVLDFRVSDVVEAGRFLRCNIEHHGIAVLPGEGEGRLHHHAWEVRDIGEIVRLADLLDSRGERLIWGPIRHGAGNNIAAYFVDPAGVVVEYYTDMLRIYDEDHVPGQWTMEDPRSYSLWAPIPPPGDFMGLGVPPAARDRVGRGLDG